MKSPIPYIVAAIISPNLVLEAAWILLMQWAVKTRAHWLTAVLTLGSAFVGFEIYGVHLAQFVAEGVMVRPLWIPDPVAVRHQWDWLSWCVFRRAA